MVVEKREENLKKKIYVYGFLRWLEIDYGSYYVSTGLEFLVSEIHKSIFGVGFVSLPPELGGKIQKNRFFYQ